MQGCKFPDLIVVSDNEGTSLSLELHILRLTAQDRMFKDAVSLPQRGVLLYHSVGPNFASGTQNGIVFDHGIRTDANSRPKRRVRAHDRGRM
jgi:hypothetical protein